MIDFRLFGGSKASDLAGLDISTSAVKLVELSGSERGGYRVERFALEAVPRGAMVGGSIADMEAVGGAIHRLARRVGIGARNVAVALPTSSVITKQIFLPAGLREFEMEAQVEAEAGQIIPFSLEEVNLDFQVVGPSAASDEDVEVLVAAARKDKIADLVGAVEAGGLKAAVVDVEAFAAQAAFDLIRRKLFGNSKNWTAAMIDIGSAAMKVTFLRNNQQVYSREHGVGGNQLTQGIVERYGMSPDEAEAGKISGDLPDGYERDVLVPFRESVALEVSRALQFFFTSTQFNEVDHIVVSGGGAQIEGIAEAIKGKTNVETTVANPFASMSLSSRVRSSNLLAVSPSLMVACGLAFRRFDA